jgi:hypothetical protein
VNQSSGYTGAMNEGEFERRRWRNAIPWFGMTAAGIIFFLVYIGPVKDCLVPAIFFPTTTVGIGGGLGALYGRAIRGALISLGAEIVFYNLVIPLAMGGLEDYRGVLMAATPAAGFIWLMLRATRKFPEPK